ncbi:MAG: (d)CMP kinase [Clostridia bacterium]|nr:(d)CMP kinase [Clostridia bacterium]MDD7700474.1 (d)CMP kinase [Eubacteriales bacterium]MDY2827151.1 (d)CMP kinase [Eubacteriales bacterium]
MIRIAIDGPSGAGKSSVAKLIARKLGIIYVDTGALYRTVGLYVRDKGIARTDADGILSCLPEISIEMRYEAGGQRVFLNGKDPGDRIREPEISMYASAVSALPAVRQFLLSTQRNVAEKNSVIMDGRDIGTVILPGADVKVFLTASDEARARRRTLELQEKGMPADYESVLREMRERDGNDRNRAVAPAVAAPDAVLLDNSDMDVEETADEIIRLCREKGALE